VTFSLHDVAPRLALARDQWVEEQRVEAVREMRLVNARLRADRLLAHRELQALRAGTTKSRSYVRQRYRKLDQAKKIRKRLE
jgi:hypothetical protein